MVTSKRFVGIVLLGLLSTTHGAVMAQSRAESGCTTCGVAFSYEQSTDGARLRALGAGGIVVDKQLNQDGLTIELSAPGDAIRVVAMRTGIVTLTRREHVVTVRPDSVLSNHDSEARRLMEGSRALEGLELMVHAVRYDDRPEAVSLLATFALLRSLRGDETGNSLLAHRTSRPRAGFMQIQAPSRDGTTVDGCWDEYERTLMRNHDRYGRCLRDYWWAQPVQYACAIEFAMVAELALFRVIACAGGFPIG